MTATKPRLKSEDWIVAGFKALSEHGPEALKAEPLARALGTTKGSFYWHFKDVPDYHLRLLALWEQQLSNAIDLARSEEQDPVKRLHRLGDTLHPHNALHGPATAEPAIRAWAYGFSDAATAVQRVDQKRLSYLDETLKELGLSNPDFKRIVYGAYIGLGSLSATDTSDDRNTLSTLLAAILALRDA